MTLGRGQVVLLKLLERDERNLAWLARKTGWSLSHLYRVTIGERPVSRDLAAVLAELFGVPIETFVDDEAVR